MSQREEKGAKASKPQYGIGSNILYLLKLSREVPGLLFQQGLKALINVAISVIGLYLSPTLLSLLEQRRSPGMLLGTLGGFVLALFAVHAAKGYLDQQWIRPLAARANIMNRINAKLGSCSYPLLLNEEFQSKWNQGMKACDGNGSAATEVIWRTMFLIPENMICFGVYLALLTRVQPFLILITLLTSGLGYIITYHFVQKEHRYQEEGAAPYRKDHVLLQTVCDSRLAKDVRIFGMREWLEGMHNQYQRLAEDIQKRRGINNFLGDMASLGLNFLRNGIAYAYLLAITLKGDLPAGEFLLYFTAVTGFTAWITGILNGFNDLHRQSIEISAIREFINFPEPFLMEGGKKPVLNSRMGGTFELRNVSYRYPRGEKPVFSHLNLTIGPGEKLAVVGENGAGKTTLIKLLCGFLDPDEGQVLLNGVDIREYNRREYYELFSAVFQDFSILGGSVAENVAQCSPPETEKVWSCLERAGVRERIERLQDALETRLEKTVYPEAIELSGGELMALEGRYAELFRIQSKYYREGCGDGSDETALIFSLAFGFLPRRSVRWTFGCTVRTCMRWKL